MLCSQSQPHQGAYELDTIINYTFADRKTESQFLVMVQVLRHARAKPQMPTVHAFGGAYAPRPCDSIFSEPGLEVSVLLARQLCASPAAL